MTKTCQSIETVTLTAGMNLAIAKLAITLFEISFAVNDEQQSLFTLTRRLDTDNGPVGWGIGAWVVVLRREISQHLLDCRDWGVLGNPKRERET